MSKLFACAAFCIAIPLSGGVAAAELSEAQLATICGQRSFCTQAAVHDAGTAADGAPRLVAEIRLTLADRPKDASEEGCRSDSGFDGGSEVWIVNGNSPPVRLLALCNNGYGASGVGEDEIEVEDNRLTHTQHGGSAWRWQTATTWRLEPPTRIETVDCSYHTLSPGSGTLTQADLWNLRLRSFGFDNRDPAAADEIGCPESAPASPLARPASGLLAALVLPGFGAGDDPRQMRQVPTGAALADCALAVSTDGANGFLVHGRPSTGEAAEMRIVADSGSSLVVQVFDPLARANRFATSWVHQPHVELWRIPQSGDSFAGYSNPKNVEQIGIDLDGKPWPGINAGKLPGVERWTTRDEKGREVIAMRVTWAEEDALAWGIAAVYSQAEQGRQARLVATTGIERNRPLFLPPARRFDRDCALENGLWKTRPLSRIGGQP